MEIGCGVCARDDSSPIPDGTQMVSNFVTSNRSRNFIIFKCQRSTILQAGQIIIFIQIGTVVVRNRTHFNYASQVR